MFEIGPNTLEAVKAIAIVAGGVVGIYIIFKFFREF